jgi:hypothetical protein
MPIYRFICEQCGAEYKRLMRASQMEAYSGACIICGAPVVLTVGKPEGRAVETADEYKNKKKVQDAEKLVLERAQEHHRKHELPRIIADRGIDYARENGLVDEDGRPKNG